MKRFKMNVRRFVSCCEAVLFIVIVISGIALYVSPSTRIAYTTLWRFLGFSKYQWQAIHITASILFLLFGIVHIYYNWKAFRKYIINEGFRIEFLAALLLGAIVVFAAIKGVTPVNKIMAINWTFKHPALSDFPQEKGYYFGQVRRKGYYYKLRGF